MKDYKKDIPALVGLIGTTAIGVITTGISMPLAQVIGNISVNIASNFVSGFTPDKVKKWFIDTHPDDLNHSIKKLFVNSINKALYNIYLLFLDTNPDKATKKEIRQLINLLQKQLPDILLDNNQIKIDEAEVKHFLYEKNDSIIFFIKSQFVNWGITDPFKSFLAQNLPVQIQLCFGEELKDPVNHNAWVAFQRMLIEEIRYDIKQIADTQQSIKDDLSDLKFEKSGFSKEQMDEIHQLINLLNNKKLIEVKLKSGIDKRLKSIEAQANEIIQITTQTNITVEKLKHITEKIQRQNSTNIIIIYSLSFVLIIAAIFIVYKLVNQPFTTTIHVYGWEGKQHHPLDNKETIGLRIGNRTEKKEIDRNGMVEFSDIPSEYNGKKVPVFIENTQGMSYFLPDSIVIHKNGTSDILVKLKGLDKFIGTIYDEKSGEGLPDVLVTAAGCNAVTDEWGHFCITIPLNKQRLLQNIEISKTGYKSIRHTEIPMAGEHEYKVFLKRD
jgi:hypothetical protein